MRIEVDYSGCGSTRSVLKWIAVVVALQVALLVFIFCEDEVFAELSFRYFALLMAAGWRTEKRGLL